MIEKTEIGNHIFEIKIPTERLTEMKDGKRKITNKKFLPGYILLEMDLPLIGWKPICNEVKKIQGVTGFVGAGSAGKPSPITDDEARNIFKKTGDVRTENVYKAKNPFSIGDNILIIDGAFDGFSGIVEEVHHDKMLVKARVEIFGRRTLVSLNYPQIENV